MQKYNLYIVSDEIYEKVVFDGKKNISIGSYRSIADKVITVKCFQMAAMTGWRIGYTAASKEVTDVMYNLYVHTITGISPFVQRASLEVFQCEEEIEEMRTIYESRRNYFTDALDELNGVECRRPEGAFYAWVRFNNARDSKEACRNLLDQHGIIGVDGQSYGEIEHPCVRFSFASNMEVLKEAIEQLKMGQ